MSGECDKCGEHCLDCKCPITDKSESCYRRQKNDQQPSVKDITTSTNHLNPIPETLGKLVRE